MKNHEMREELIKYYWNEADKRAEDFCDKCIAELDSKYNNEMSVFSM